MYPKTKKILAYARQFSFLVLGLLCAMCVLDKKTAGTSSEDETGEPFAKVSGKIESEGKLYEEPVDVILLKEKESSGSDKFDTVKSILSEEGVYSFEELVPGDYKIVVDEGQIQIGESEIFTLEGGDNKILNIQVIIYVTQFIEIETIQNIQAENIIINNGVIVENEEGFLIYTPEGKDLSFTIDNGGGNGEIVKEAQGYQVLLYDQNANENAELQLSAWDTSVKQGRTLNFEFEAIHLDGKPYELVIQLRKSLKTVAEKRLSSFPESQLFSEFLIVPSDLEVDSGYYLAAWLIPDEEDWVSDGKIHLETERNIMVTEGDPQPHIEIKSYETEVGFNSQINLRFIPFNFDWDKHQILIAFKLEEKTIHSISVSGITNGEIYRKVFSISAGYPESDKYYLELSVMDRNGEWDSTFSSSIKSESFISLKQRTDLPEISVLSYDDVVYPGGQFNMSASISNADSSEFVLFYFLRNISDDIVSSEFAFPANLDSFHISFRLPKDAPIGGSNYAGIFILPKIEKWEADNIFQRITNNDIEISEGYPPPFIIIDSHESEVGFNSIINLRFTPYNFDWEKHHINIDLMLGEEIVKHIDVKNIPNEEVFRQQITMADTYQASDKYFVRITIMSSDGTWDPDFSQIIETEEPITLEPRSDLPVISILEYDKVVYPGGIMRYSASIANVDSSKNVIYHFVRDGAGDIVSETFELPTSPDSFQININVPEDAPEGEGLWMGIYVLPRDERWNSDNLYQAHTDRNIKIEKPDPFIKIISYDSVVYPGKLFHVEFETYGIDFDTSSILFKLEDESAFSSATYELWDAPMNTRLSADFILSPVAKPESLNKLILWELPENGRFDNPTRAWTATDRVIQILDDPSKPVFDLVDYDTLVQAGEQIKMTIKVSNLTVVTGVLYITLSKINTTAVAKIIDNWEENVEFEVILNIPSNAELGPEYFIRVNSLPAANGLTSPLRFFVDFKDNITIQ